jgi:DNA-binding PadR family transcriptional regulator
MRHPHFGHHHHNHHCHAPRGEHGDGFSGGRGRHGHGEGDLGDDQRMPGGRGGRGGGRIFGHGGLRFVLLQLIADKPSHGYELIKSIEDRLGGAYSPSPGTVYPTLTLLEEQGYLSVEEADAGGRKRYRITAAGSEFLEENRDHRRRHDGTHDRAASMARAREVVGHRRSRAPSKTSSSPCACGCRAKPLTPEQANAFAAVLDHAAQQLEQI